MGKYPVVYKVSGYSEKEYTQCGIVFADTYADAVAQIEDAYGDEILCIDHLFMMEEGPVTISEEIMHKLIKGEWDSYEYKS